MVGRKSSQIEQGMCVSVVTLYVFVHHMRGCR
jgi:hypothetical protein